LSTYADTSFLVSLYVLDANSALAAAEMKTVKLPVLLTPFGEFELLNALYLRRIRKELSPAEIKAARALFNKDLADGIFQLEPIAPAAYERAKLLARKHTPRLGARALDVLHVASALTLHASSFYTFDRNQKALAKREGLTTLPGP
jgi:predicted nucleic acid-binding protein